MMARNDGTLQPRWSHRRDHWLCDRQGFIEIGWRAVENDVPSCPDRAKASATAREVICRANNEEQRTGNKKQGPARDRRAKDASKAERRAIARLWLTCCAAYRQPPAVCCCHHSH